MARSSTLYPKWYPMKIWPMGICSATHQLWILLCRSGPTIVIHHGNKKFVVVMCAQVVWSPNVYVQKAKQFGRGCGLLSKWSSGMRCHGTDLAQEWLFRWKVGWYRRHPPRFHKRNMSLSVMPQRAYAITMRRTITIRVRADSLYYLNEKHLRMREKIQIQQ